MAPNKGVNVSGDKTLVLKRLRLQKFTGEGVLRFLKEQGILFSIILLGVFLTTLVPVFATPRNLVNLLINSTITLVMALGVTFTIISGGIDLSVASNLALSAAIGTGLIVHSGWPVWAGILITIAIGVLVGLANGLTIAYAGMTPLIATLAMMSMARGLVFVYTNGANIYPVPEIFRYIGTGKIGPIPVILLIVLIIVAGCLFVLHFTRLGRFIYVVGGNRVAGYLSGIDVRRIELITYILSGFLAAIAGILLTARLESAGPRAAYGAELTVVAGVVIGGTSLKGGEGSVKGTILGVLLISMVDNAINLLMIPAAYNDFFRGLIIFVAALIDTYRRRLG